MKKLFIVFMATFALALAFLPCSEAIATSYSTSFPKTENPISQNGKWINGGTVGLDWSNVQTTGGSPGKAYGTQNGATAEYNDSIALLTGTWGPNQTVTATVYTTITGNSNFEEVELHVRSSLSAHNSTGYEINFSVNPSNPYVQIVRWNGPFGSWTELNGTGSYGAKNGDVIMAKVDSTNTITAYINGTAVLSWQDSTFTTGSPGVGFYAQSTTGTITDNQYGFTSYSATDGTASNLAGPFTDLSLMITYEEEIGNGSQTLSEGQNFVTVTPGIDQAIKGGLKYDPVLYLIFDSNENLTSIYISWISPNQTPGYPFSGQRIWTMSCQPGAIAMKPQVSLTKPPATKSNLIEGNAACTICPDGIAFNNPTPTQLGGNPNGTPTGVCNGGGPYGVGYLTFTGTDYKSLDAGSSPPSYYTTSVSVTGAVGGSAFNYVGDDWASKDGVKYSDWTTFPAIFTGTFDAKVAPCSTDPSCITQY